MYVTRFELATFWSVARRSIQLSYTYIYSFFAATEIIIVEVTANVNNVFDLISACPFWKCAFLIAHS